MVKKVNTLYRGNYEVSLLGGTANFNKDATITREYLNLISHWSIEI